MTDTRKFLLGMNAALYAGAEGQGLPDMAQVSNVKDVTLALEAAEADITTRENQGWRATAATLKSAAVDFQMLWRPNDAPLDLIKNAFLTGGPIAMAVIDMPWDQTGEGQEPEGIVGDWVITSFPRSEELENAQMINVSAKLARFDHWHEGVCDQETSEISS